MNSFILTFQTSHQALEEEEKLQESDFIIKMIPTPRGISSDCGFSIRVDSNELSITEQLTKNDNSIERIYLIYERQRSKNYEEIYRRKNTPLPPTGD